MLLLRLLPLLRLFDSTDVFLHGDDVHEHHAS